MNPLRSLALIATLLTTAHAEDYIERLRENLAFSAFDGNLRVRLSGVADLEAYSTPQPPPGLLFTDRHTLLSPRLSLFLDAQLCSHVYAFAQMRVDRGFDPADEKADVRLDEYALRISPWEDGRFTVQIGRFATVVGNWVERHLSWDNPFITAPLPYENLTGIWDSSAPDSPETLLYWAHVEPSQLNGGYDDYSDKYLRNPIIWGPSYASGVSVSGRVGKFDYALEMKNSPLSSRPEAWDATAVDFDHPAFNGRLGFRPNQMWNVGFSFGYGPYMLPEAAPSLPPGRGIGDYHQTVFAQDIRFEWHRFQLWAEVYEARFEVPNVGHADTLAYYVEAKYKFTPQSYGALRWNQQFYNEIHEPGHGAAPWGDDVWRIDAALGYRFSAHTQLKLQFSLQNPRSATEHIANLFAAQFTVKF
ncbi:MAG: hypothetical protein ABMA13_07505 [Chthoniobacteraceae bacterium]